MKTSMITAVACLMAGAIASPIVEAKAVRTMVDVPVANEARDVQLSDRGLLGGGLLGGTSGGLTSDLSGILNSLPLVNGLPDLTQLPNLNVLSSLVGQIVEVVKNIEATIAGSNGQGLDSLLPSITQQLTVLNSTVAGLQSTTSGVSGTGYGLVTALGVQTLLAQVYTAIARLFASINTQAFANIPEAQPVLLLLNQIIIAVGSALDISPLNPSSKN